MDINIIINNLENQKNGIIILNKSKEVLYINKKTMEILGNDINQVLCDYFNCEYTTKKKANSQITGGCDICRINTAINNIIKEKEVEILENIEINKNNIEIKLSVKISLCEEYILLELFDLYIKDYKNDFLLRLADKSMDCIFVKDEESKYFYVNKTYADFLNKEKDYIIGKTDIDLLNENILSRELYEQCLVGDKETLSRGYYDGIEVIGDRQFRVSKESIDGGILGTARDITNEIDAVKKAETDQLTGLYNRHKFEDMITEIYSNNKNRYYMALIDLDDLRGLNNKYGHLKGDNYIKILGEVLKNQRDCIFFRIGGDEFAGFIDCDKICPSQIFKEIFEELNMLNLAPKLSISVGINKFDISKDYEQNYKETDKILYEVKKDGKNKFIINYNK